MMQNKNPEVYIVDTSRKFSQEKLMHLWQVMIPHITKLSDEYEITCESGKEGSSRIIETLSMHSQIKNEKKFKSSSRLINFIINKLFNSDNNRLIVFTGSINQGIENLLLSGPLPDESVPADISPCQEVLFYRDKKLIFSCFDYGVFLSLYLDENEIKAFVEILIDNGISPEIILYTKDE